MIFNSYVKLPECISNKNWVPPGKHTRTHTCIYIYAIGKTTFFKYFSDLQVIFRQLKIASTTKSRVQSCSQGTCGSRASAQSVAPPQHGPERGVTRYFMGFSWGYTGEIKKKIARYSFHRISDVFFCFWTWVIFPLNKCYFIGESEDSPVDLGIAMESYG